jgi:hypothetical protein
MRSVLLVFAFIFFSCTGDTNTDNKEPSESILLPELFDYNVFIAEKAAWEAQKIDRYRFTGGTYLDYLPITLWYTTTKAPNTTEVAFNDEKTREQFGRLHGNKDNYEQLLGEISLDKPFRPLEGKTIDELFESIADESNKIGDRAKIKILYNKTYHYPEYFVKYMVDEGGLTAPGGGYSFEITDFEVLDAQ